MKRISMLLIAGIMAIAFVSCDKAVENPEEKPLGPEEQGTYLIDNISTMLDQIEAEDFQPAADIVKKYANYDFNRMIEKSPKFGLAILGALQKMVQSDSSIVISLSDFNGKYTIGKDSIITIDSTNNIQIIDKTGTKEYALVLNYSGDSFIMPVSTSKSKKQIYVKVPQDIELTVTCDDNMIVAADLEANASLHSSIDEFDSTKDHITFSGLVTILGYTIDIDNASLKDSKVNIAASLSKKGTKLFDAAFDLNNVLITNSELKNLGGASASLSFMKALQVKGSAPSFLAIAALARQYAAEENPTQTVAQQYADQFNQLFSASVYYNSDIQQSQIIIAPYYSATSGKWIFLPCVKIGDNVYTLSNYEGFFTQKQVEDLTTKIITKVTGFAKFFKQFPDNIIIF